MDDQVDVRVGEVWGIRAWGVESSTVKSRFNIIYRQPPHLMSIGISHAWDCEPKPASHGGEGSLCFRRGGEEAPGRDCSCGYWMIANGDLWNMWEYPDISAVGLVRGWGKVAQHNQGFRVQYCRPVVLYRVIPDPWCLGGVNDELAERYGAVFAGRIIRGAPWAEVCLRLQSFGYDLREGGDCEHRRIREGDRGSSARGTDDCAWRDSKYASESD